LRVPTAAFGYCLQERRSCDLDPVFFPVGKRGWGEMEHPVMFQGVAKDSPAFRLMTQMGWEEGKGLGKDKQGIKSHIRVRNPREEKSGVGVYEKEKAASDWTVNTHVFDNILKNLNLVLTHYPVKPVFTYAWNLQKNC
jgi:hypothetical protein